MGQAVLVDGQIEDGRKRIEQIRRAGLDITVAFWAKADDETRWYLYIASEDVDRNGALQTYRKIHAIISKEALSAPWVDRFQIKLIPTNDPIAQAALEQKNPAFPTFYSGPYLGDLAIDEAYIYPDVLSAASAN